MNDSAACNWTKQYFPDITECATCNMQYKCVCLYDSFHYLCLGCGRQSLKYHPPYQEKIVRHYCVEYEKHIEWYRDADLHNEQGPAVEFFEKTPYTKLWFINGVHVDAKSLNELLQSKEYRSWKLKAFE